MNKQQYWKEFYTHKHTSEPTEFAKFIHSWLPKESKILELGCGNGRDSYYFGKNNHKVYAVDNAIELKNTDNVTFIQKDVNELFTEKCFCDYIYARCFIHTLTDKEIDVLLRWTKKYIMAEFRAKEDVPLLYPNHYRNKIEGDIFIKKMIDNNFDILYYIKSNNLAIYKEENPVIIRIIGKKNDTTI